MRTQFIILILFVIMTMVVGCAHAPTAPSVQAPGTPDNPSVSVSQDGPHRLWGEYDFLINAAHDKADVVPRREARFHLNALKFLESYCSDCLKITGIKNNGDSTIDLTVQIRHPFPGHPQYTGFDVKGIIMFQGSHVIDTGNSGPGFGLPNPTCTVSWRELGDPQVLNADGYTLRWSPTYNSGSDLPIFNYWKGKHASGEPYADVNAYLDFYSTIDRHMFTVDSVVTRTYRIWLPTGQPLAAGYAVEACWEPPIVTPVKDPLTDFPSSANQPEPYHLKFIVNNGMPAHSDCCQGNGDCSDWEVEYKQWEGPITTVTYYFQYNEQPFGLMGAIEVCDPLEQDVYSPQAGGGFSQLTPGKYQWLYVAAQEDWPTFSKHAFDLLEFEVIE